MKFHTTGPLFLINRFFALSALKALTGRNSVPSISRIWLASSQELANEGNCSLHMSQFSTSRPSAGRSDCGRPGKNGHVATFGDLIRFRYQTIISSN
jgi:hypothetical protein